MGHDSGNDAWRPIEDRRFFASHRDPDGPIRRHIGSIVVTPEPTNILAQGFFIFVIPGDEIIVPESCSTNSPFLFIVKPPDSVTVRGLFYPK